MDCLQPMTAACHDRSPMTQPVMALAFGLGTGPRFGCLVPCHRRLRRNFLDQVFWQETASLLAAQWGNRRSGCCNRRRVNTRVWPNAAPSLMRNSWPTPPGLAASKYAKMCALAYRECAAACGLAADDQRPAAILHQREHQQRRHRHRGCLFPDGPAMDPALAPPSPKPRWSPS